MFWKYIHIPFTISGKYLEKKLFQHLILNEIPGVLESHRLRLRWVVDSGEGQATQSVTTSSILACKLQYLLTNAICEWNTVVADTNEVAAIQNTFSGTLSREKPFN